MLREEDLRIDRGRASHGGDFVRLTHVPPGVARSHPGPSRWPVKNLQTKERRFPYASVAPSFPPLRRGGQGGSGPAAAY